MSDALPTYRTRHKGLGKPLWSDGIHFVRPASAKDRHKMRFVVGAHKATTSTHKRHAPTEEEAIERAKAATSFWLAAHPADRVHLTVAPADETTEASPSDSKAPAIPQQPFATTLFDCVYANPVAQVWLMTRDPGEHKPVGRRKANGRAAEQTSIPHTKGESAVLRGSQPIRNADGSVRVFHTQGEAEEYADHLYREEPEEDTISWKPGNVVVGATARIQILFNPTIYGVSKPFILWLAHLDHPRPVYVDRTHATQKRAGISVKAIEDTGNTELALAFKAARARERQEDRQPSFEERPLRFRSIWAATEEADRRERMLRGEVVN